MPKGFTKAIERLRKGQQDRENMQRVFEELSKGSVVRKVRPVLHMHIILSHAHTFFCMLVAFERAVIQTLLQSFSHIPAFFAQAVVRDEKGRTVHQPFTLQTEKRAATREAAPQLGITGLLDQAGVPQAAYAQPPDAPENVVCCLFLLP